MLINRYFFICPLPPDKRWISSFFFYDVLEIKFEHDVIFSHHPRLLFKEDSGGVFKNIPVKT